MSDLHEAFNSMAATNPRLFEIAEQKRIERAMNTVAAHKAYLADDNSEIFRSRIEMDKQTDFMNRLRAHELRECGGVWEDLQ